MPRLCCTPTFQARALRQRATPAEKALWELLRGRRLDGAKFRRQHPIGPFIVDFLCVQAGLVIEADGAPHLRRRADDLARDQWLQSLGLTVLRFFNHYILEHPEAVARAIRAQLAASRKSQPFPLDEDITGDSDTESD